MVSSVSDNIVQAAVSLVDKTYQEFTTACSGKAVTTALIEEKATQLIGEIEKLPQRERAPQIKKITAVKRTIAQVNKKIWDATSFIEKCKWYLSRINWATSAIQFVGTNTIENFEKLEKVAGTSFLKGSDDRVLFMKSADVDQRFQRITQQLQGASVGVCALIEDESGKAGKFILHVVGADVHERAIPITITKDYAEAEIGLNQKKQYKSLSLLIQEICGEKVQAEPLTLKEEQLLKKEKTIKAYCPGTPTTLAGCEKMMHDLAMSSVAKEPHFLIAPLTNKPDTFTIFHLTFTGDTSHIAQKELRILPGGIFEFDNRQYREFEELQNSCRLGNVAPVALIQNASLKTMANFVHVKNYKTLDDAKSEMTKNIQSATAAYPVMGHLKTHFISRIEATDQQSERLYLSVYHPEKRTVAHLLIDYTSRPGEICLHQEEGLEVVGVYKPEEFNQVYRQEFGELFSELEKHLPVYQRNTIFFATFQDAIYSQNELGKRYATFDEMKSDIKEKLSMASTPEKWLKEARPSYVIVADSDVAEKAVFTLFTYAPASKDVKKVERVTIRDNGQVILQELDDEGRIKTAVLPRMVDSLDVFKEGLADHVSLKPFLIKKEAELEKMLTTSLKQLKKIQTELKKATLQFPLKYDARILTRQKSELAALHKSVKQECERSKALWKDPHLLDSIALEIQTIDLRIKIATAVAKLEETAKTVQSFNDLEKVMIDLEPLFKDAQNPLISNMEKTEFLRISGTCEFKRSQCAARLFPIYVKEEIPALIKKASPLLRSTDWYELQRERNTIQCTLTMVREAEKLVEPSEKKYLVRAQAELTPLLQSFDEALERLPKDRPSTPQKAGAQYFGQVQIERGGMLNAVTGNNNTFNINVYRGSDMNEQQSSVAKGATAAAASSLSKLLNVSILAAQAYLTYQTMGLAGVAISLASSIPHAVQSIMPQNISPATAESVGKILQLGSMLLYAQYGVPVAKKEAATKAAQEGAQQESVKAEPEKAALQAAATPQPQRPHTRLEERRRLKREEVREQRRLEQVQKGPLDLRGTPRVTPPIRPSSGEVAPATVFSAGEPAAAREYVHAVAQSAAQATLTTTGTALTGLAAYQFGPFAGTLLGKGVDLVSSGTSGLTTMAAQIGATAQQQQFLKAQQQLQQAQFQTIQATSNAATSALNQAPPAPSYMAYLPRQGIIIPNRGTATNVAQLSRLL